jgi:GT2 family glycosyltransferase
VLLVDNGSGDGTVEEVRARFSSVETIVNDQNLGFSGGFNVGLRYALALPIDYILVINNDTWVAPDMLDALMACARPDDVGMLGPMIYAAADPKRIWSVGGDRSWWTLEMTNSGDGETDAGQYQIPMERDYLAGCAILLKRTLLEQVGLFDAATFSPAYYEDSDLCLRASRAGWRLLMVPSAKMWHKGVGTSGGFDSPAQRYLMARNGVRFFRKHVHGLRWLVVIPWRLGSAVRTTLRLLLDGRLEAARAYWIGLRDGVFTWDRSDCSDSLLF